MEGENLDKYAMRAVWGFQTESGSMKSLKAVRSELQELETAVKRTAASVDRAGLSEQFKQTATQSNTAMRGMSRNVMTLERNLNSAVKELAPLKAEFRALRAAAKNIDFGDTFDPSAFKAARVDIERYIASLKLLEGQVDKNTFAGKEFAETLKFQRKLADERLQAADLERKAAVAAEKVGAAQTIRDAAGRAMAQPMAIGKKAISILRDFDDQMSAVKAVSLDMSDADLGMLRKEAKRLGATTAFSASDAAESMVLLAQAGQKTDEIMKTTAATLTLASSGALGMAEATDITISSMGAFDLKADKSKHVVDVLALAAAAGATDVQQIGEAMKYAGPPAKAFGASIEQTSAMIGVLSNAGIKASNAGTALRSAFLRLASPPKMAAGAIAEMGLQTVNADGSLRDINEILVDVGKATAQVGGAKKIELIKNLFGTEASASMLYIVDHMKEINKETFDYTQNVGFAEESARQMEHNIGGAFRNLDSAVEGFYIEIGEVLKPAIVFLVNRMSDLLTAFIVLPKPVKTVLVVVGALVTGALALTAALAGVGVVLFTFEQSAMAAGLASLTLRRGLIPLTGFFDTAMTAFRSGNPLTLMLNLLQNYSKNLPGPLAKLALSLESVNAASMGFLASNVGLAAIAFAGLYAVLELATPQVNLLGTVLSAIVAPFGFLVGFVKGFAKGLTTALAPLATFGNAISQQLGAPLAFLGDAMNMVIATFENFSKQGEAVGAIVGMLVGSLINPFVAGAALIQSKWQGMVGFIQGLLKPFADWVGRIGDSLVGKLAEASPGPTLLIRERWSMTIDFIKGLLGTLVAIADQTFTFLKGQILSAFQVIQKFGLVKTMTLIAQLGLTAWKVWQLIGGGALVMAGLTVAARLFFLAFQNNWLGVGDLTRKVFEGLGKGLLSFFQLARSGMVALVALLQNPAALGSMGDNLRDSLTAAIVAAGIKIKTTWEATISWVKERTESLGVTLGSTWDSVGSGIIGVFDAIRSGLTNVLSLFGELMLNLARVSIVGTLVKQVAARSQQAKAGGGERGSFFSMEKIASRVGGRVTGDALQAPFEMGSWQTKVAKQLTSGFNYISETVDHLLKNNFSLPPSEFLSAFIAPWLRKALMAPLSEETQRWFTEIPDRLVTDTRGVVVEALRKLPLADAFSQKFTEVRTAIFEFLAKFSPQLAANFSGLLDAMQLPDNLIPQWGAFKLFLLDLVPVIRKIENFFPDLVAAAIDMGKAFLTLNGIKLTWLESFTPFLDRLMTAAAPVVWWIGSIIIVLDLLKKISFSAKLAVNGFNFLIQTGEAAINLLRDAFSGFVSFLSGSFQDALDTASLVLQDLFAPQPQAIAMVASGALSPGLLSGITTGAGQASVSLTDLGTTSTKASTVITSALSTVNTEAAGIGQSISDTYGHIVDWLKEKFKDFKDALAGIGPDLRDIWSVMTQSDFIIGAFAALGNTISQGISNIFNATIDKFNDLLTNWVRQFLGNLTWISAVLLVFAELASFLESDITRFIGSLVSVLPFLEPIQAWLERTAVVLVRFLPALTALLIQFGGLSLPPGLPQWFYSLEYGIDKAYLAIAALLGQLYVLTRTLPVVKQFSIAAKKIGEYFKPILDIGVAAFNKLAEAIRAVGGIIPFVQQQFGRLVLAIQEVLSQPLPEEIQLIINQFAKLGRAVVSVVKFIAGIPIVKQLVDLVKGFVKGIAAVIGPVLKQAFSAVAEYFTKTLKPLILPFFQGLGAIIIGIVSRLQGAIGAFMSSPVGRLIASVGAGAISAILSGKVKLGEVAGIAVRGAATAGQFIGQKATDAVGFAIEVGQAVRNAIMLVLPALSNIQNLLLLIARSGARALDSNRPGFRRDKLFYRGVSPEAQGGAFTPAEFLQTKRGKFARQSKIEKTLMGDPFWKARAGTEEFTNEVTMLTTRLGGVGKAFNVVNTLELFSSHQELAFTTLLAQLELFAAVGLAALVVYKMYPEPFNVIANVITHYVIPALQLLWKALTFVIPAAVKGLVFLIDASFRVAKFLLVDWWTGLLLGFTYVAEAILQTIKYVALGISYLARRTREIITPLFKAVVAGLTTNDWSQLSDLGKAYQAWWGNLFNNLRDMAKAYLTGIAEDFRNWIDHSIIPALQHFWDQIAFMGTVTWQAFAFLFTGQIPPELQTAVRGIQDAVAALGQKWQELIAWGRQVGETLQAIGRIALIATSAVLILYGALSLLIVGGLSPMFFLIGGLGLAIYLTFTGQLEKLSADVAQVADQLIGIVRVVREQLFNLIKLPGNLDGLFAWLADGIATLMDYGKRLLPAFLVGALLFNTLILSSGNIFEGIVKTITQIVSLFLAMVKVITSAIRLSGSFARESGENARNIKESFEFQTKLYKLQVGVRSTGLMQQTPLGLQGEDLLAARGKIDERNQILAYRKAMKEDLDWYTRVSKKSMLYIFRDLKKDPDANLFYDPKDIELIEKSVQRVKKKGLFGLVEREEEELTEFGESVLRRIRSQAARGEASMIGWGEDGGRKAFSDRWLMGTAANAKLNPEEPGAGDKVFSAADLRRMAFGQEGVRDYMQGNIQRVTIQAEQVVVEGETVLPKGATTPGGQPPSGATGAAASKMTEAMRANYGPTSVPFMPSQAFYQAFDIRELQEIAKRTRGGYQDQSKFAPYKDKRMGDIYQPGRKAGIRSLGILSKLLGYTNSQPGGVSSETSRRQSSGRIQPQGFSVEGMADQFNLRELEIKLLTAKMMKEVGRVESDLLDTFLSGYKLLYESTEEDIQSYMYQLSYEKKDIDKMFRSYRDRLKDSLSEDAAEISAAGPSDRKEKKNRASREALAANVIIPILERQLRMFAQEQIGKSQFTTASMPAVGELDMRIFLNMKESDFKAMSARTLEDYAKRFGAPEAFRDQSSVYDKKEQKQQQMADELMELQRLYAYLLDKEQGTQIGPQVDERITPDMFKTYLAWVQEIAKKTTSAGGSTMFERPGFGVPPGRQARVPTSYTVKGNWVDKPYEEVKRELQAMLEAQAQQRAAGTTPMISGMDELTRKIASYKEALLEAAPETPSNAIRQKRLEYMVKLAKEQGLQPTEGPFNIKPADVNEGPQLNNIIPIAGKTVAGEWSDFAEKFGPDASEPLRRGIFEKLSDELMEQLAKALNSSSAELFAGQGLTREQKLGLYRARSSTLQGFGKKAYDLSPNKQLLAGPKGIARAAGLPAAEMQALMSGRMDTEALEKLARTLYVSVDDLRSALEKAVPGKGMAAKKPGLLQRFLPTSTQSLGYQKDFSRQVAQIEAIEKQRAEADAKRASQFQDLLELASLRKQQAEGSDGVLGQLIDNNTSGYQQEIIETVGLTKEKLNEFLKNGIENLTETEIAAVNRIGTEFLGLQSGQIFDLENYEMPKAADFKESIGLFYKRAVRNMRLFLRLEKAATDASEEAVKQPFAQMEALMERFKVPFLKPIVQTFQRYDELQKTSLQYLLKTNNASFQSLQEEMEVLGVPFKEYAKLMRGEMKTIEDGTLLSLHAILPINEKIGQLQKSTIETVKAESMAAVLKAFQKRDATFDMTKLEAALESLSIPKESLEKLLLGETVPDEIQEKLKTLLSGSQIDYNVESAAKLNIEKIQNATKKAILEFYKGKAFSTKAIPTFVNFFISEAWQRTQVKGFYKESAVKVAGALAKALIKTVQYIDQQSGSLGSAIGSEMYRTYGGRFFRRLGNIARESVLKVGDITNALSTMFPKREFLQRLDRRVRGFADRARERFDSMAQRADDARDALGKETIEFKAIRIKAMVGDATRLFFDSYLEFGKSLLAMAGESMRRGRSVLGSLWNAFSGMFSGLGGVFRWLGDRLKPVGRLMQGGMISRFTRTPGLTERGTQEPEGLKPTLKAGLPPGRLGEKALVEQGMYGRQPFDDPGQAAARAAAAAAKIRAQELQGQEGGENTAAELKRQLLIMKRVERRRARLQYLSAIQRERKLQQLTTGFFRGTGNFLKRTLFAGLNRFAGRDTGRAAVTKVYKGKDLPLEMVESQVDRVDAALKRMGSTTLQQLESIIDPLTEIKIQVDGEEVTKTFAEVKDDIHSMRYEVEAAMKPIETTMLPLERVVDEVNRITLKSGETLPSTKFIPEQITLPPLVSPEQMSVGIRYKDLYKQIMSDAESTTEATEAQVAEAIRLEGIYEAFSDEQKRIIGNALILRDLTEAEFKERQHAYNVIAGLPQETEIPSPEIHPQLPKSPIPKEQQSPLMGGYPIIEEGGRVTLDQPVDTFGRRMKKFAIAAARQASSAFEDAAKRSETAWAMSAEQIQGPAGWGRLMRRAYFVGRKILGFISEASPGPSRQTRENWHHTAESVEGDMNAMAHHAHHAGKQMGEGLKPKAEIFSHLGKAAMAVGGAVSAASFFANDLSWNLQNLGIISEEDGEKLNAQMMKFGALTSLAGGAMQVFGPAAEAVIGVFGAAIPLIGSFATGIFGAAVNMIQFGGAIFAFLISPIGLATIAIVAGIALLVFALKEVFGIDLITPIITKFQSIGAAVQTWWSQLSQSFTGENMGRAIAQAMVEAVRQIQTAWEGFSTWFQSMPLVKFAQDVGQGLISALNHSPTVQIPIAWQEAKDKIVDSIFQIPEQAKTAASDLVSNLTTGASDAAQGMMAKLDPRQLLKGKEAPASPVPEAAVPLPATVAEAPKASGIGQMWENMKSAAGGLIGGKKETPADPVKTFLEQVRKDQAAINTAKAAAMGVGLPSEAPDAPQQSWWQKIRGVQPEAAPEAVTVNVSAALERTINNLKRSNADTETIQGFQAVQATTGGELRSQDIRNLETGAGGKTFQQSMTAQNLIDQASARAGQGYDWTWITEDVPAGVKAAKAAVAAVGTEFTNGWNDRWDLMERQGTGDLSGLFKPGLKQVGEGLSGLGSSIKTFAIDGGTALLHLDFDGLGKAWGIFSGGFKASAGAIIGGLNSMGLSALALGVYSLLGMSPLLLIIGAVAIAVWALSTNFLHVRDIVVGVIDVVRGLWTIASAWVSGLVKIVEGVIDIFYGMGDAITGDFTRIKEGFGKVGSGIITIGEGTAKGVVLVFGGMGKIISGIFQAIGDVFKFIWDGIKLAWKGFGLVVQPVADAVKWLATSMMDALSHPKELIEKIVKLFEKITGKAKEIGGAIESSAPVRLANAVGLRATGQAGSMDEARQMNDAKLRAKGLEPEAKLTLGDRASLLKQSVLRPFRGGQPAPAQAKAPIPDMSQVPTEIMGPMLMAQMSMAETPEPPSAIPPAGTHPPAAPPSAVEQQVVQATKVAETTPVAISPPVAPQSAAEEQVRQAVKAAEPTPDQIAAKYQPLIAEHERMVNDVLGEMPTIPPVDLSEITGHAATAQTAIAEASKTPAPEGKKADRSGVDSATKRINAALTDTDSKLSKTFGSAKTSIDSLSMAAATFAPALAGPLVALSALTDGVGALKEGFTAAQKFAKEFGPALESVSAASSAAAAVETAEAAAVAAAKATEAAIVTTANVEMEVSEAALGAEATVTNAEVGLGSLAAAGLKATEAGIVTGANLEMGASEAVLGAETAVTNAEVGLGSLLASAWHAASGAIVTGWNFLMGLSFTGMGVAAEAAWLMVSGPLLPIILLIGLVAAVVGGLWVAFQNNFMGIKDLFVGVWDGIMESVGSVFSALGEAFGAIWESIVNVGKVILDAFSPIFDAIASLTGDLGGSTSMIGMIVNVILLPLRAVAFVLTVIIKALGWVIAAVINVGAFILSVFLLPVKAISFVVGGLISLFWNLGKAIISFMLNPLGFVWDLVTGIFSFLGDIGGSIAGAIGSVFSGLFDIVGGFFGWLWEQIQKIPLIGSVLGAIGSWLGGGQSAAPSDVPQYAGGGPVQAPGQGSSTGDGFLAAVSNGEYVINAAAARSNFSLLDAINSGMDVESILQLMPLTAPSLGDLAGLMLTGGMGGGDEGERGDAAQQPIQIHLEIHELNIGSGGREGAREFLDALDPYLEVAVRNAMRRITEFTR